MNCMSKDADEERLDPTGGGGGVWFWLAISYKSCMSKVFFIKQICLMQ